MLVGLRHTQTGESVGLTADGWAMRRARRCFIVGLIALAILGVVTLGGLVHAAVHGSAGQLIIGHTINGTETACHGS